MIVKFFEINLDWHSDFLLQTFLMSPSSALYWCEFQLNKMIETQLEMLPD
jgi:hypothetical protein